MINELTTTICTLSVQLTKLFYAMIKELLPFILGYVTFLLGLSAYKENKLYEFKFTKFFNIYRMASVYHCIQPPDTRRSTSMNHADNLKDLNISNAKRGGLKERLKYEAEQMFLYTDPETSSNLYVFIENPTEKHLLELRKVFQNELYPKSLKSYISSMLKNKVVTVWE